MVTSGRLRRGRVTQCAPHGIKKRHVGLADAEFGDGVDYRVDSAGGALIAPGLACPLTPSGLVRHFCTTL